jgi:hypothetical protein
LIFGLYDVVVGSLSSSALREDLAGSLAIIVPVGVGAALGIAALSNVLKVVLVRFARPAHGVLLGLLVGSVLGLWPFQEARYPELLDKPTRKQLVVELEGLEGDWAEPTVARTAQGLLAAQGLTLGEADWASLAVEQADGRLRGGLKRLASTTEVYRPGARGVAAVFGLFVLGFLLVRRLAPRAAED